MYKKPIQTAAPIIDPLADRWSGRAYDPARSISRADLISLLEAARWAPSCFGDQPWRYLLWDKHADAANWRRALACLGESNRIWAQHAPLLLLSTADSQFVQNGKPNRWGQYDTGASAMALCTQAATLGIMVHQMGGFDAARVTQEFAIPARYQAMAMAVLGYQLPADKIAASDIPSALKEREAAPRERRALAESFFMGQWGNGVTAK